MLMARSSEQKQKAQKSTYKYLILREALEIEAMDKDSLEKIFEDKAGKIINEAKYLHLDDFVRSNPWDIFDIFGSGIEEKDRNKIKETLKKKKAQLDLLLPEEKENLKKLFLDEQLKSKLITENNNQDEDAKTLVADGVDQIYKFIDKASISSDLFKKDVDKIADIIFNTQATTRPNLSIEVRKAIDKVIKARELSKKNFKESLNEDFAIIINRILTSSSWDNFIKEINAMIKESGNEEFTKSEVTDNVSDKGSKKLLDMASSYILIKTEEILKGSKEIPPSNIKKYCDQLKPSLVLALKEKIIFKQETAKLQKLISAENELLSPLVDVFNSFTKTASSLTSGALESIANIVKDQSGKDQEIEEDKLPSLLEEISTSLTDTVNSLTSEIVKSVTNVGRNEKVETPTDAIPQQICDARFRYLIMREVFLSEDKSEEMADKIIIEAKEFYLDDFAKENLKKNSATLSIDEKYKKRFRQEILEEIENKKIQLDNLPPETKADLKKLFIDDQLRAKLINENSNEDEGKKTEVADVIDKIYINIETASKSADLFEKIVNKVGRSIFAITATNAVLAGQSRESVNKGEEIKAIFKSSLKDAFKIVTEAVKKSVSHAEFVKFVNDKVNEIIQKSDNEDLKKLNEKRIEYQNAQEPKAFQIKKEFYRELKFFYDKTADKKNIDKSNMIFGAFSCYLQKEKISTAGQDFNEREKVLAVASIFVQSGANAYFNYGCKLLPQSDLSKYLNQVGEASYRALDNIQTLDEESKNLRGLINREDEFFRPLISSFNYINKTFTSLSSRLINKAMDSFKQDDKEKVEVMDKSSQTIDEEISELPNKDLEFPGKDLKSSTIQRLSAKFEKPSAKR